MVRGLRRSERIPLHCAASVIVSTQSPPRSCIITEISAVGAELEFENGEKLPYRFTLLLTTNGSACRFCELQWQKGSTVDVRFTQPTTHKSAHFPNYVDEVCLLD